MRIVHFRTPFTSFPDLSSIRFLGSSTSSIGQQGVRTINCNFPHLLHETHIPEWTVSNSTLLLHLLPEYYVRLQLPGQNHVRVTSYALVLRLDHFRLVLRDIGLLHRHVTSWRGGHLVRDLPETLPKLFREGSCGQTVHLSWSFDYLYFWCR